ncbi:MAG: hydrolase [Microgenomates group bacterium]
MKKEEVCCERFDPTPWDGKTVEWKDKKFIKDTVFTLFYIPLNFGSVMTRLVKKVDDAKAKMMEGLVLSDSTSSWNMDLYLAVDKEIDGAKNVTLSGKFFSKVYEGSFKDTGVWMKDFESYCSQKGVQTKKTYMWYTTCPKCAEKYGKNYVVIFGQLS